MRTILRLSRAIRAFPRAQAGVSAVEFAMIAPLFVLILAGVADIGAVLHTKFRLNSAMSAGANYAMVNGGQMEADGGETLATALVSILTDTPFGDAAGSYVQVNGGVSMSFADGRTSIENGPGNAGKCYCPAASGSGVDWGPAMACQTACSGGGLAGKYVLMSVTVPHSPLFGSYGIAEDGRVSVRAVVQVR